MSRITLVPTFRAGQTPHRLPLSSRDNLALRSEGFGSARIIQSRNPSDETGLSFFAGIGNALCLMAFGVIVAVCVYVYLLAGGWR